MKIKLSKSQWEFIGKQAHWILSPEQNKALNTIFNALEGKRNKSDRITRDSVEITYEDVWGEAYIQVYLDSSTEFMMIEKYFESEMAQQDYGKKYKVPINYENPNETITNIKNTIQKMMRS